MSDLSKRWFILPQGTAASLPVEYREAAAGITEIVDDLAITPQLSDIPDDVEVAIIAPQSLPPHVRDEFIRYTNACWMGIKQTRRTMDSFMDEWVYSALKNFDRLRQATPIDRLSKPTSKETAILFGNGPSLQEVLPRLANVNLASAETFVCWHALSKVQGAGLPIDYLCHIDWRVPKHDFIDLPPAGETKFIATSTTAPRFVEMSAGHSTYVYLSADFPLNHHFQRDLGCKLHTPIHGTVASILLNAAIYAGYEQMVLVGVDNAWPVTAADHPDSENVFEFFNSHGTKLKSSANWQVAADGLAATVRAHPDLRVFQSSQETMDISGVSYRSVADLFPGGC